MLQYIVPICNDHRSLQNTAGGLRGTVQQVQGSALVGVQRAKPPEALKILHFTVPKMALKLMHFCRGIVVEVIRIGRQKISQKITFISYTNEGVRNP